MEEPERREDQPDTATQDLDEKNPSVPPSREGVPSEEDAAETLPGVPEEAREEE
ncbi:MAG TPA: hypothetical protein VK326_09390 [Solirubrobacterales bacterium]|nr:hypothetical protein [Solirubrobacterales bacterium]